MLLGGFLSYGIGGIRLLTWVFILTTIVFAVIIYKKQLKRQILLTQTGKYDMIKKDYSQAIFIAKLISFIGWGAVIVGIIGVIHALNGYDGYVQLIGFTGITISVILLASSIIITLFGLALIVVGQASRAMMDNANYSAAILAELKQLNSVEKEHN